WHFSIMHLIRFAMRVSLLSNVNMLFCVRVCLLVGLDRNSLRERLVPPFAVSDFTQGLPFLLTLADRGSWITEWKDRKDLNLLWNSKHGINLFELPKADPV